MALLEYTLLAGLLFGLFFSLVGIGLNLIFGVLRVVNLAHGDFIMLGAFLAFYLYHLLGWNPLVAVPLEIALFLIIGLPLYYLLVPRLLKGRDPEMLSFILFFGLSQVIEALAVFAFGNNERSIPDTAMGMGPIKILGQIFPATWVVGAAAGLLAIGGVYLYLYRSRLGYATRAVMASREEAQSSGINVDLVSALAFSIGLILAGLAGVFSPFMLGSIYPSMGVGLTTISFAIIVIGSLGNALGTVAGGLIYGLGLMLMQTYLPSWSDLLPYLLLIVIILLKPNGLFGHGVRHA